MKAFTDIAQSQVLAGILPIESADMCINSTNPYAIFTEVKPLEGFDETHDPCWSLAALMELMPERIKIGEELSFCLTLKKSIAGFSFSYNLNGSTFVKDNPIDAAFEMIVWLKDNKKI